MQKLRSKLGLVVMLSCLTLAIGLVASTGSASAHGGGHHPVSKISPRISMKVLSGRFKFHSHYVQRVVLSGFGFDTCDSCANASAYNGCDGSCNSSCDACSSSCPYYSYNANACENACNQGCSSTGGNGCANYNACGTDGNTGYSSCPSNCGGTTGSIVIGSASGNHPSCTSNCGSTTGNVVGSASGSHPSCSSNCGSTTGNIGVGSTSNGYPSCPSNCGSTTGNGGVGVNDGNYPSCASTCGSTTGNLVGGSDNGNAPCASYNACSSASSCDCANVQSNLSIYGQDANLSQVPLNAFGEFRVVVLVQVPAHASRVHYRMWAINRYNNDCSNILSGSQNW